MTHSSEMHLAIRRRPELYLKVDLPFYQSVVDSAVGQVHAIGAHEIRLRFTHDYVLFASDMDWLSGLHGIEIYFKQGMVDQRLPPNSFRFEVLLEALEFDFWTTGDAGSYGDDTLLSPLQGLSRDLSGDWKRKLIFSRVSRFEQRFRATQ